MKHDEPRSELARYAFGYSDRKPTLAYWLIHAGMIAYVAYKLVTLK